MFERSVLKLPLQVTSCIPPPITHMAGMVVETWMTPAIHLSFAKMTRSLVGVRGMYVDLNGHRCQPLETGGMIISTTSKGIPVTGELCVVEDSGETPPEPIFRTLGDDDFGGDIENGPVGERIITSTVVCPDCRGEHSFHLSLREDRARESDLITVAAMDPADADGGTVHYFDKNALKNWAGPERLSIGS